MLEISLTGVAAFAAYTFYAITSDLKATKQPAIQNIDKAPETAATVAVEAPKAVEKVSPPKPKAQKPVQTVGNKPETAATVAVEAPKAVEKVSTPMPKAAQKPKAAPKKATAKPAAKPAEPDPVEIAANAILAFVTANGPVTLNKLIKDTKLEKGTVELATEKLINDKTAVAIKRGGQPSIALAPK